VSPECARAFAPPAQESVTPPGASGFSWWPLVCRELASWAERRGACATSAAREHSGLAEIAASPTMATDSRKDLDAIPRENP
jgi:hypothetical protein